MLKIYSSEFLESLKILDLMYQVTSEIDLNKFRKQLICILQHELDPFVVDFTLCEVHFHDLSPITL